MHDEVVRVAAGLLALDVRPEERVLMCMVDEVELFTAILAAMHVGAVSVPCSAMLTAPELRALVVDSRARVVADPGRLPAGVEGVTWSDFLRDGPVEPYPTWPDSPALWLYTSGTTGVPKAAMHRHANIRFVAENYAGGVLGITRDDRCLSVAKLFFAYGMGNSLFFPLSVGGTALLEPGRPPPALFAARASRDRATLLFGTPSFWGLLLASDVASDAFSSVRQGVSAGEALPARMYEGMLARFASRSWTASVPRSCRTSSCPTVRGTCARSRPVFPFPVTRWTCGTIAVVLLRRWGNRGSCTCAGRRPCPGTGVVLRRPEACSSGRAETSRSRRPLRFRRLPRPR